MVAITDGTSALNCCNIAADTSNSKEVSNDEFNKLLCDTDSKSDNISIDTGADYDISFNFLDVEEYFLFVETDKVAISSFEDYKSARISHNLSTKKRDIGEINFEKEFEKYLEYKNCNSADELSKKVSALNKLTSKEILPDKFMTYNEEHNCYCASVSYFYRGNVTLKGQVAEFNKKELVLSYRGLLAENKDYNSYNIHREISKAYKIDIKINSIEDFIENYDIINPPSFDEYCNKQLNGIKRDVNFETEFKNYLASRGCATESELKALNSTGFGHANQLIESTNSTIYFFLRDGTDLDSVVYIQEHLSIEDRADFYNTSRIGLSSINGFSKTSLIKAFKNMLEKFRNNPNVKIDFNKIASIIDDAYEKMRNPDKSDDETKANEKTVNKKKALFGYNKV